MKGIDLPAGAIAVLPARYLRASAANHGGHSWYLPVMAGVGYFACERLVEQISSADVAVVANALLSTLSIVATFYFGWRAAVSIGVAALTYGLWTPSASAALGWGVHASLAILSVLHPLAAAASAHHYLVTVRNLSIRRALIGLLLSGPSLSFLNAALAALVVLMAAHASARPILAALAKWAVVSAFLTPLALSIVVTAQRSARQNAPLSLQQLLPALATVASLIALILGVRHIQDRDERVQMGFALRSAATQDIAELTAASWVDGVETILASEQDRPWYPILNRYLESLPHRIAGLERVTWIDTRFLRDSATSLSADDKAAASEALRSGRVQFRVGGGPGESSARYAYAYRPVYSARPMEGGEGSRSMAALGVLVAVYGVEHAFPRLRQLAANETAHISLQTGTSDILSFGWPLSPIRMSKDIAVREGFPVEGALWHATFRKRGVITSISDVRPVDFALSAICLLLSMGIAFATLETLRRRRQIDLNVRRRTIKLAREVAVRQQAEAKLRNARDQIKSVFAAIPIPTLLIDVSDLRILDCNASVGEMLARDAETLNGKFLASTGLPDLPLLMGLASAGAEIAIPMGRIERRYVVISNEVVVENRRAALVCFSDVTRLHEVETGLRSANDLLEQRVMERTAELSASRQQIRTAMDHSPIGLAMVDLSGRWFDVNDSTCRILGFSREELLTLDVYRITQPEDLEATKLHVQRLLDGHSDACTLEKRYLRKDGLTVWVQLDIAVVRDEAGKPQHFVAQIQDITDKRLKAQALSQAAKELEALNKALAEERTSLADRVAERTAELRQANEILKLANDKATLASKAKSEFVAVMSHEIRTPLSGVLGALDLLQSTSLRNEQQELVCMGLEAARSLLMVVDDVLDFSRIESGAMQLDPSEFALEERIGAAVESMLPMARRLDADLSLCIDPSLPDLVLGDELRLQQIVRNLVANALKFSAGLSRRAKVTVSAALAESGADGQLRAQIAVRDNGIGMSAGAVANLFEPFTQADQSTTRRFGGSGLGLSICNRLARLMGGAIQVVSSPDAGSTFTMEMPLKNPIWSTPRIELEGKRVYVESADPAFADGLKMVLRSCSADIVDRPEPHSVSVIDVLPAADSTAEIPGVEPCEDSAGVLLLTRNGPRRGDLVAPGVVMLDRQVIRTQALVSAILKATSQEPAPEERPTPQGDTSATPAGEQPLVLLVEDNPMNQALIQRQLQLLGFRVAVAPDGEAGITLWRQLRPAAILTDLHMPVMDGYGMSKRILSSKEGAIPPIIALTADADTEERRKCLAIGMSGYITKPVRVRVLSSVLRDCIQGAVGGPVVSRVESPEAARMHFPTLEDLAAHDQALITALLETFTQLADEAAAELRQAADEGDSQRLAEAAHKFKSSARTIGAQRLGALCESLERVSQSEPGSLRRFVDEVIGELSAVLEEVDDRLSERRAARAQGD